MIKEQIFAYGQHHHGIGVISEPEDTTSSPVVVLLNAGLSHRAEPYRLNVLLGRQLAAHGYIALRVDLSGKGDSPASETMSNRDSVALDWSFIKMALEKLYGPRNFLIFGLCSGADNGIKLCAKDNAVKGLILLDPVSRHDKGFAKRDLIRKLKNPNKWMNIHKIVSRRFKQKSPGSESEQSTPISLRDEPNTEDMNECFKGLVSKEGRVLSVFTSQALYHYDKQGQFTAAMDIAGLEQLSEEIFWQNVKHTYPVEVHRNRLIEAVTDWAARHRDHFQTLRPESGTIHKEKEQQCTQP